MSDFKIRKATTLDEIEILNIFVRCTDFMLQNGIHQWKYDYPNAQVIRADVAEGTSFVLEENNQILGTICLNQDQDIQYKKVHWRYRNNNVLVIHRLAVSPLAQGKGIGKLLCLFAEDFARKNNFEIIRLDAYSGNPFSNQLYVKLGYHRANGYCYFHKQSKPFYCYEKKIGESPQQKSQ